MASPALKVVALLAATGALSGFIAAQFIPRQYISRATVTFDSPVSSERRAMAAAETLSTASLTPLVTQSDWFHHKPDLDYTPVEEVVDSIRDHTAIAAIPNGFRLEFTDPDRAAALDLTQRLTDAMSRNTGGKTRILGPIRTGLTGPSPALCTFLGLGIGLVLGFTLSLIQHRTNRVTLTTMIVLLSVMSLLAQQPAQQPPVHHDSVTVTDKVLEPTVDLRNDEVFNRTLFTRDDQVLQQLNGGINTGQHEGGGKSIEVRRFGFNLDHGGVNGGLKVMVDDVPQNQGSQGHGQGYLGSLKALSPELIQEVRIVNGPFSAEYGDFSGLGVVRIKQRDTLPDEYTIRLQGGNFDSGRGFFGYSPALPRADAYFAYEGSYTDGPFINPGRYRRDNVNAHYGRSRQSVQAGSNEKYGVRFIFGRNNFYSSGQIPLDLVDQGLLPRFGFIDPSDGGKVKLGTLSAYYSNTRANGDEFRADAFLGRSLFDLYSNFTFFLNDQNTGDGIQQHDSRLQEGVNSQYSHYHRFGHVLGVLTAGGNFHDNQINVGLYPREGRVPLGVATRANAHVTNGAGYVQENISLFNDHLILGGGLRFDAFRWDVRDRVDVTQSGAEAAGRWQPKANLAWTPSHVVPLTLYANYGRGINSQDARGVVQRPDSPRLATTDFYQTGISSNHGRFAVSADAFLIDHSNEQVYIPDDGTFEFKGPSRAYGYEVKSSVQLTHRLSLNGGITKIGNAFFKGGDHRVYVDSAPHFVANAALTLADWRGWSGSLRMRAVNHYRLDGDDPSIVATGLTVFDMGLAKQVHKGVELNLSFDNLTDRAYYETQNYLESRVTPTAPVVARIHGTPGYPFTAAAGVTFRLRAK